GGNCIGKINGKTVFVPYAIPGETLEVEITEEKQDYDMAKIVSIVKASPHRVKPECPLYQKCGGCNMMHIDKDYQRELRIGVLKDAFEREGLKVPEIIPVYGDSTGYRCRFQFHNGGLKEKESNSTVELSHCPIATEEINNWLSGKEKESSKGRVHVFGDKRIIARGDGNDTSKIENRTIAALEVKRNAETRITGRTGKKIKDKAKHYFSGTSLVSQNICTVDVLGKKITFDVQGFFQSNLQVLEKTIEKVCDNMGGERVLDMYSGCGTFSVFLSDLFKDVTLVEHNRDALVFAEQNLMGKKHTSYGMSGEKFVETTADTLIKKDGMFDAVVIDPPRLGMEKTVCDWLCKNKTYQIRAVSCDPATQARDISKLVKAGYSLTRLYLLDFYPQTCHIESLACLEDMEI
ncbi:MAG: 23S rRNA (uracil(1939)-C(5))-methyltransferase RlmD, partial [Treponema sp.]|nr:23S rRNA (uracil(1939)-C(5))-methyltransferase RlmD [Treponema sp.]